MGDRHSFCFMFIRRQNYFTKLLIFRYLILLSEFVRWNSVENSTDFLER